MGAVTLTRVYDAWGTVRFTTGTGTSRLGYTGEWQDGNLVYLRARWYHSGLGSFTSRDTFQGVPDRPQSLHRYGYTANNPVNRRDPTGHDWRSDAQWLNDRVGLDAMQRSATFFGNVAHTIGENPSIVWQLATHPCVLDSVQETLDIMGVMPVLGMPFDIANTFISAGRGDYSATMIRSMFALPGVGDAMAGMHLTSGMGRRFFLSSQDPLEEIQLIGFQGAGAKYYDDLIDHYPLTYAGHVGLSLDQGEKIFGFTPYAPHLSNRDVVEQLKGLKDPRTGARGLGELFPGVAQDDTSVFEHAFRFAQELQAQGIVLPPPRLEIYVWRQRVPRSTYERILSQLSADIGASPMDNVKYGFPSGFVPDVECYNCALYPERLGIDVPLQDGALAFYIPELIKRSGGERWRPR